MLLRIRQLLEQLRHLLQNFGGHLSTGSPEQAVEHRLEFVLAYC